MSSDERDSLDLVDEGGVAVVVETSFITACDARTDGIVNQAAIVHILMVDVGFTKHSMSDGIPSMSRTPPRLLGIVGSCDCQ